jgi:SpoVK/Ycf46/Vps4 family AAA+-type ATPase
MFGKRSEVRDSHDRYANLGTAYLLQRIENAPTPTILTTNLKEAIDPAFTRRLHFVVDFPFPMEHDREEIWRWIFPPEAPLGELRPEQLAKLAASGGTISNIARRAAFLAAANGGAIEMHHLLASARRELRKTADRDLSPEELSGWQ